MKQGNQEPKVPVDKKYRKEQKNKDSNKAEQDKIDSVFLAKELIMGDELNIGRRLFEFKEIKNQNYDKFTNRIQENLKKINASFSKSRETFCTISRAASNDNTTGHQMASILQGFYNYWKQIVIEFEEIKLLFNFIIRVYLHVGKKFIHFCRQLIQKNCKQQLDYFEAEATKLVDTILKNYHDQQDKVLSLVFEFDLYGTIPHGKIIEIANTYKSSNQIAYIFKTHKGQVRQQLVKMYLDKCLRSDDTKRCESLIKGLDLDPFQYQNLIVRLKEKYLNYQLRSYPLYFIELSIKDDKGLVQILAHMLLKNSRDREAKYFILKYQLNQNEYYYTDVSQKETQEILAIANVLQAQDRFGPTEIQVLLEQTNKQYLYLREFDLFEQDIIFVDQANIQQINCATLFASKQIGIDSQNIGGVHVFDPPRMTLIQIFTGQKILIFDYVSLQSNPFFHAIMKEIFTKCKIYGHDHLKELTAIQRQLELDIKEVVMQELMRDRCVDTNKLFKKVYPKETRSNLAYLSQTILKKTISKFQQCSGWGNRPLRKAQLHYASLDCVLPVILGQHMEKSLQRQKK